MSLLLLISNLRNFSPCRKIELIDKLVDFLLTFPRTHRVVAFFQTTTTMCFEMSVAYGEDVVFSSSSSGGVAAGAVAVIKSETTPLMKMN